jgi:hypothetical protein
MLYERIEINWLLLSTMASNNAFSTFPNAIWICHLMESIVSPFSLHFTTIKSILTSGISGDTEFSILGRVLYADCDAGSTSDTRQKHRSMLTHRRQQGQSFDPLIVII